MDNEKDATKNSKSKMLATPKAKGADLFDFTVLSTPQPQASSTVRRKSRAESKYVCREEGKQKHDSDIVRDSASSLGILDNISMLLATDTSGIDKEVPNLNKVDVEREFARKLLQKCSNLNYPSLLLDTDKENDVNAQNTSFDNTPSTLVGSAPSTPNANTMENSLQMPVIFSPAEITARSSAISKDSEVSTKDSDKDINAISFSTTTAELMAQFNNEEFHSGSQMLNQIIADEASWQQNYSFAMPVTTNSKTEYLDLSCFSGIIGEHDLSIESCAGHRVSVGEFFKRKCGNIGELSGNVLERPSFGLSVTSPKKRGKPMALVDVSEVETTSTEETKSDTSSATEDTDKYSVMSLSSIAKALEDIDNGTPRRLVDQLIMAKKKKRYSSAQEKNKITDTYTILPLDRQSLPVSSIASVEKLKEDLLLNRSKKLSLDSRRSDTSESKPKLTRMLSYTSELDVRIDEACKSMPQKEIYTNSNFDRHHSSSYQHTTDIQSCLEKSSLPDPKLTSHNPKNLLHYDAKSDSAFQKMPNADSSLQFNEIEQKLGAIKKENVSYKSKLDHSASSEVTSSHTEIQSNNVVIGNNTEDLCYCVVGLERETNIELINKGDRCLMCSVKTHQMQENKETISIKLPKDIFVIKPYAVRSIKFIVKMLKMTKPIIAIMNITITDMVTRSEWSVKHIMCFSPEELKINIITPTNKMELKFECTLEDNEAILPLIFENKNNTNVSLKFSIVHNGPEVFSIEDSPSKLILNKELKRQEKFTSNIQFKNPPINDDIAQKQASLLEAVLLVHAINNHNEDLMVAKIPLIARINSCKIQLVASELPIIIKRNEGTPITIANIGNTATTVIACVVQNEIAEDILKEFSVKPEKLFLQCNETGTFIISCKVSNSSRSEKHVKIKLATDNSNAVYHYPAIEEGNAEPENNDYLRCETPQYLLTSSSPTSPRSVTSNRSGISGRNSPGSSMSGGTVAGDKLPIRATHAALVWNSVKAGKNEIKEFTIRNTSNNKIRIQAVILDNDKSFRFLRERQTKSSSIVLSLQCMESRMLSVMFNPHRAGAVSGKITFKHYEPKKDNNEPRTSKVISLYGYGGCGKVDVSEVFKDISGKIWLSLGLLNSHGSLTAKLKLENTGDLRSYAKVKLIPKAVYPAMVTSWQINPTELLLNPREVQWVSLKFHPRKEDLALLQQSGVSHVGTLSITHGDEPTRWRIRRLFNKLNQANELAGSENEAFRNVVYPICRVFPGEQLISDLNIIHDSVQNLGDLCRGVNQYEIMLTVEVKADETLSVLQDNADESQLFYSLCSDNSHVYEACGESFLPSETMEYQDSALHETYEDHFMVRPSVINLMPPNKVEAKITILSSYRVAQPFETVLSTNLLSVFPSKGMLPTGKALALKVRCKQEIEHNFDTVLEICTENNKQDVLIKVLTKHQ